MTHRQSPEMPPPAPHSEDMETALLCCMVLNWEVREECATQVPWRAFFEPKNQIIFSALLEWRKSRYPVDFIGFKEQITKASQLEEIGGLEYLSQVWGFVPVSVDYRNNVKWVIDYYHRREAIAAGHQLIEMAYDTHNIDQTIKEVAESLFTKLVVQSTREEKSFQTLISETIDIISVRAEQLQVSGVQFGIPLLDLALGGLHPGELWVIAAQTSGGKSALALQAALLSSRDRGIASAIFSLEMDAHELIERMLAHAGDVSMRSMRGGLLTELECKKLHRGVKVLASMKMFIEDDFSLGVTGIISRARLLRLKHSIGLIVIDYFQLIDSLSGSDDSREREISKIVRASKMLARELNIPVIGISQLNDTGQLRESRTIGHHADGVLKLDPSESEEEGIVDITVVKMRNGPRGKRFAVRFDGQFMQFRDR
jgi:replicative DNA helicase